MPMPLRSHYQGPQTPLMRRNLSQGDFGAIAPYWCERCGLIWTKPEYGMTHAQTLESPEEGENYCPDCGSPETGRNEAAPGAFKRVRRYRINRTKSTERAA